MTQWAVRLCTAGDAGHHLHTAPKLWQVNPETYFPNSTNFQVNNASQHQPYNLGTSPLHPPSPPSLRCTMLVWARRCPPGCLTRKRGRSGRTRSSG